jgi:hypothetical protein
MPAMSNRSFSSVGAVLLGAGLMLVAACSEGGRQGLTTPTVATTAPPGRSTPTTARPLDRITIRHDGFEAGGGSGIVASSSRPGVFWAIRDRGGVDRPGQPQNALYAFKVVGGEPADVAPGFRDTAVELPVQSRDWEAIGRDDDGNLWVGDIGNNECDRADTAVHKVREPDPGSLELATVLATYRFRFPDPPPGCAGRNAEAMFLFENRPYIIDKAAPSTVYRFPELDPRKPVTLERVGTLAGGVQNLSGADLSGDHKLLAVDTHTALYIYRSGNPKLRGRAFVADMISRPPRWTIPLERPDAAMPVNVEGVAFDHDSQDLTLLAENRDLFFVPAAAYQR